MEEEVVEEVEADHPRDLLHVGTMLQIKEVHLQEGHLLDLTRLIQHQVQRIFITIFDINSQTKSSASTVPVAKQQAPKPSASSTPGETRHVVEMRGPGLGQTIVGSAASGLGLGMGMAAGQAYLLFYIIL